MNRYFITFPGYTSEFDTPVSPTYHWDFGGYRVTRVCATHEMESLRLMSLIAKEPDRAEEIIDKVNKGFEKVWYAVVCSGAITELGNTKFITRPKLVWMDVDSEDDVKKALDTEGIEIRFCPDAYLGFECEVDAAGIFVPYISNFDSEDKDGEL